MVETPRHGKELFLEQEHHLPTLLPGESLYSWCARFHRLNLGQSPRATSRTLFGHPHAGLHNDIPCSIAIFAQRTQKHLGSAFEILRRQTVFGFHARFLSQAMEEEIAQLFIGADSSLGRSKLGLKKADQSRGGSLRFCPECSAEQFKPHGYCWWLISHQLPTSFCCVRHGCKLHALSVEQSRGVCPDFYLPAITVAAPMETPDSADATQKLCAVSEWGQRIWADSRLRLTDDILRWCYRLQAKNRGWVAFDGSLRMQELRDGFVRHYGGALEQFDSELLGNLTGVNGGFLAYLLRRARSRRHPLKHVLLLNFLFSTFEAFEEVLTQVLRTLQFAGEEGCEALLRDSQTKLIELVREGNTALVNAAQAVGTSITSAARFIDKRSDIPRDRRPHIVRTPKEESLRQLLEQGLPKKEIAQIAGIRRGFIKDYLAQRPELRARWEKAYRVRETGRHRAQFMTALAAHPALSIKAIRRLPKNGYQWLYNHDREWLQEKLPAIWKHP